MDGITTACAGQPRRLRIRALFVPLVFATGVVGCAGTPQTAQVESRDLVVADRTVAARTPAGRLAGLELQQSEVGHAAVERPDIVQAAALRGYTGEQRVLPQAEPIQIPEYPEAVQVGGVVQAGYQPPPHGEPRPWSTSPVRWGVQCDDSPCGHKTPWKAAHPLPWEVFAQGEYVGPARLPHVPEYRLRVDDTLDFVYRLTRVETTTPYRLNVGDLIQIESLTVPELAREVLIQPDGTITLPQLGQVPAANRSLDELRKDLDHRYQELFQDPRITVTPIRLNTKLEDLRATVDSRAGAGGQARSARVTPEGTIQLPAIGSVPAQGLTLDELKREVEQRYAELVHGIEVTPILLERAPRFIYVVGEVRTPGRFELTGPTTVMQAIALAGSWNNGGNLQQVVVFRRDDQWRLMATKLSIRAPLYGNAPCPGDEIWLRDSDIVVVPKRPILVADDLIELVFTRGIYGVVPINYSIFTQLSTL